MYYIWKPLFPNWNNKNKRKSKEEKKEKNPKCKRWPKVQII